jgi:F-type H+-transporting ATPase subunit c
MFRKNRIISFLVTFGVISFFSTSAFAQQAAAGDNKFTVYGFMALGLGIAAVGSAIGQGFAASSALEGIGRNPGSADEMQTPLIISLVFMEALTLYAVAFPFIVGV